MADWGQRMTGISMCPPFALLYGVVPVMVALDWVLMPNGLIQSCGDILAALITIVAMAFAMERDKGWGAAVVYGPLRRSTYYASLFMPFCLRIALLGGLVFNFLLVAVLIAQDGQLKSGSEVGFRTMTSMVCSVMGTAVYARCFARQVWTMRFLGNRAY